MANKRDDYDWLDDPFDERKAKAPQAGLGGGAKAAAGIGCVAAILLVIALFVLSGGLLGALAGW